jgi:hypothetical protein
MAGTMTIQFYDKDVVHHEDLYHETEYHLVRSVSNAHRGFFLLTQKSTERVSPMNL